MSTRRLDDVDRLILHELTADAGLTYAELGAKVGLSESQCLRRVRALEETKVIQRYVTLIDPNYLNLRVSAFIEVRVHGAHENQTKTLERVLAQRPDVGSYWRIAGEADYLLRGIVADPLGYERLLDALAEIDGVEIIRTHLVLRLVKPATHPPFGSAASAAAMETAFAPVSGKAPHHDSHSASRSTASVKLPGITTEKDSSPPHIDELDRRILRTLANNARMSNAQLADRVGLSPAPCLRRVRALETAGVILGYHVVVDFDALDMIVTFIMIRLKGRDPEWQGNFERAVSQIPEVVLAHRTHGGSDYVLRCVASGLGGMERLLRHEVFSQRGIDRMWCALSLRYCIPDLEKASRHCSAY
jgi:Lrp/AsnC family leucine-responsive transcriptional regulator